MIDQLIVLTLLRQDIEAGNINRAYGVLAELTADTDRAIQHRRSLAFMFEGYDRDKREIYSIPEVREFFNNLANAWPYWAWYMEPEPTMPFISLLMSLLTPGKTVVDGKRLGWSTMPSNLALTLEDLLTSVDELGSKLNLPSPLVSETKDRFAAAVRKSFSIVDGDWN